MRTLGEFYTPEWLARLILDESGYSGAPGQRLLDPSCGPGVFLVLAIERAKRYAAATGEPPRETARRIMAEIQGFELNSETAAIARTNYLAAMGGLRDEVSGSKAPVRCIDAILQAKGREKFDFIVGNPPWVRWDYLPPDYREATLPLWKRYGLFSLKGFETRLGGGKKDLSMLFTYAAADRYLKDGGALAFVITQEVFKSKGAGEGFRRFRLGPNGPPLKVYCVHDFVKLQPFRNACNKTAAIILTKGEETVFPVPYYLWDRDEEGNLRKRELCAHPVGSLYGPWQTVAESPQPLAGANPYRAVLGANANPYGIFWLDVQGAPSGGLVAVRNLPELGKKDIQQVSATLEAEPIYPAVRGADLRRWAARPGVHVLLVQDPETRRGVCEEVMRRNWPRTFGYLEQFREELVSRALYRKYHEEGKHPFYSQFNISSATFAPFKVVWRRMSDDLSAAVISDWEGPLGRKMLVPLETTAFIGTQTAEEAHYLCTILNSRPVRAFVRSFSSAGRGFGTPFAIRQIRIPKFDAGDRLHGALAELSLSLHAGGSPRAEGEIDDLILRLGPDSLR